MPTGIFIRTEQHKQRISDALKKAYAENRHTGGAFVKGHKILGFKGKKHSNEWKKNQSIRIKNNNPMHNINTAQKLSRTLIDKGTNAGENNNNWKGGRTKYRGANWHKQRKKALERDNYKCQVCGVLQEDMNRELTIHHIIPYHEGGTNDLENLITVCMSCHFTIEPRGHKRLDK